ncbi:MAG: right-handed parallel beta-helix repeat-containing protein [Rikenellaceae bacterium]
MGITKLKFTLSALLLLAGVATQARNIYVSPSGSNMNDGSKESPYRTISKAAYVAIAGDSVIIHEGTYRERVSPANGGTTPARRITYTAAPGEKVYIKGSEVVKGWKKVSGNVWKTVVDNSLFGDFNPFELNVYGDWLLSGNDCHLGQVYIDGKGLAETPKIEDVKALESNKWHAVVTDEITTIYANFDGASPVKALTEINVRPTCFYPNTNGVNYITVDGLNISQAATQWAAPTSEQIGIVGPNWSKGWIIKNCDISYSRCVGVSIGKERSTGQNLSIQYRPTAPFNKVGFTREVEAIISAINRGWCKENIGSHLIENNKIYECGQAGVVGHLGCAFSTIRGNEIYDICHTGEFGGFETAGIKLHAGIDVVVEGNVIVNTGRGMWMDWQAQGMHVLNNVLSDNDIQDFFIEVSHGPTVVANNIMLSEWSIYSDAQGIAFANNIIAGRVVVRRSTYRYTPYHVAHSTQLFGFYNNGGGDIRYYNNLFFGQGTEKNKDGKVEDNGLEGYNAFPDHVDNSGTFVEVDKSLEYRFPIYTSGNVYYKGAVPFNKEKNHKVLKAEAPKLKLERDSEGRYTLSGSLDLAQLKGAKTVAVNTDMLGQTIVSEQVFENADLTPFVLDYDYFGRPRKGATPVAGPFESAPEKYIWSK